MPDTGFNWSAWTFLQKSAGDWENDAITNTNNEASDLTSLDGKAACEISMEFVGGTGTVATPYVTVHILGDIDGAGLTEDITNSGARSFVVVPVVSTTVYKRFSIDPAMYGSFVVNIENESDITVTMDVRIRTATIPVASA
jgi:hypothetical protein